MKTLKITISTDNPFDDLSIEKIDGVEIGESIEKMADKLLKADPTLDEKYVIERLVQISTYIFLVVAIGEMFRHKYVGQLLLTDQHAISKTFAESKGRKTLYADVGVLYWPGKTPESDAEMINAFHDVVAYISTDPHNILSQIGEEEEEEEMG